MHEPYEERAGWKKEQSLEYQRGCESPCEERKSATEILQAN